MREESSAKDKLNSLSTAFISLWMQLGSKSGEMKNCAKMSRACRKAALDIEK